MIPILSVTNQLENKLNNNNRWWPREENSPKNAHHRLTADFKKKQHTKMIQNAAGKHHGTSIEAKWFLFKFFMWFSDLSPSCEMRIFMLSKGHRFDFGLPHQIMNAQNRLEWKSSSMLCRIILNKNWSSASRTSFYVSSDLAFYEWTFRVSFLLEKKFWYENDIY